MKTIVMLRQISSNLLLSWFLMMFLLSSLVFFFSCEQASLKADDVKDEPTTSGCFSKASLQDTPWVKDQLTKFQRPRSGPLRVVIYSYQAREFLAFENPSLSSPASYIYNCSGAKIPDLNINYNAFYDQAKEIEVLLEENY